MVRFRYGPWDPSYFAILGSLIGRGLIVPVAGDRGIAYRTTSPGRDVAKKLSETYAWEPVAARVKLLRRHFDVTGTFLKEFIYEHFPEVTSARWGAPL